MPQPPNDPLARYGRPLAAVLLAVAASLFIAAMIGGLMPFDYTGRALTYLALVAYVIAGGVVVFRTVAAAEQQPLTPARIGKWILSLWIWPLLLARR
jgi:ABC-type enterochelin transport system permease subunit